MKALDQKLCRDLFRLWGQILAIALIVACGIASFVTMQTTYESMQYSQTTYYQHYRFAQVFAQLKRAPQTLTAKIRSIPGVAQVQTRVVMDVILDVASRPEPVSGRLIAIPDRPTAILNDVFIRQGHYPDARQPGDVLISEAFAKANHLQVSDTLGAVINGRWQPLRIAGLALSPEYVYEIQPGGFLPDNQRFGVLWMGRQPLSTAFNMEGAFNDVSLTLVPGANSAAVIFQLDQLLEPFGGFGAYERQDQVSNRFLSDEIIQLRTQATIIPAIFLGIGAFLLNMLLSRLLSTQRDQMAVLKAFGYTNQAISWHFLKFVLAIVSLGSLLGIGAGLWMGRGLTNLYTQFYQFPILRYQVSLGMLLMAVGISGGSSILGAFQALSRVVALPPAEAMRPEPPVQFQATLMERLGLQALLSPMGRIILRNLERKPLQALLSILGIALSVAMLIAGRYPLDVMNQLIDVQFHQVQRDDVTVVFNEARPARVRQELAHLPGVMLSEPFRSVSARLRFEHRTHRVAMMGLTAGGELRRLVDAHLNTVTLPPAGIILTNKLAQILGIHPGEILTIEVLEGNRPIIRIPLVGEVDELIGVNAYMDIQALNRLMQEGNTTSGAFLAIDVQNLEALYRRLKQLPAVANVSLRQALIERFRQTIAQSQSTMTVLLIGFACIVAFGVVYNAARIALSERSRELATLRIIGFSRGQVAIVLLGEQAVLTLVAIPLGFLLGYGIAALLSRAYDTELYRLPLVVTQANYAFAFIVISSAALVSGWIVYRQLSRLDLVAVLKTRE